MLLKRQDIAILSLSLAAIAAYFGFSSVTDAVLVEGASTFVAPMAWFLVVLTLFSIGSLTWRERGYQWAAGLVLVIPSLFFALTIPHLGVVVIAGLFIFFGIHRIGRELDARIRVSLYRPVSVGIPQVVLALSLAISSQYYAQINTFSWDQLVPSFDLAEGAGAWMLRAAGKLSPSLTALQNRDLSVDAFLSELRPIVEVGETGETLGAGVGEAVRQAEMMRSKMELSHLLGREVGGEESVNAILSEVLRKKMIAFVTKGTSDSTPVPFLPFFLALLLFFTVYPFGALLVPIALWLATGIFTFLVRSHGIELRSVPAERESIV